MNSIEFRHVPPEDETVDAATAIFIDGKPIDFEIQHTEWAGPGCRRAINQYFHDPKGQISGMRMIAEYDSEREARAGVLRILADL